MADRQLIEQINHAIHAHGPWKLKLAVAVETGHSDIKAEIAECDDCCEFGKWIHGDDIPPALRAGKPYEVIRRLHAEFHRNAGKVLRLISEGRKGDATALLKGEFDERSHILIVALNKWKRELEMEHDQAA